MILQFLPFSNTQQFHNCVAALTNTAVYFLSLNSKTSIAFSSKTFIHKITLSDKEITFQSNSDNGVGLHTKTDPPPPLIRIMKTASMSQQNVMARCANNP